MVWNVFGLKYTNFYLNSNVHNCFISHAGYSLNTKPYVPCVGFSVAGLDHSKFGLYRFQTFLLIVVKVISIILETVFWQTPFHSQSLVKDKDSKQLLRRLKNIGMMSWKLHRNTLISLNWFLIAVARDSYLIIK